MDYTQLTAQARQATEELLEAAHLETGDIFVVGCSSSEIMGGHIGHDSSMEAAAAVLAGVLPPLQEQGVYLAAQCCEHLNRAIVLEREAAKAYGYQIVSAIPQPHAGGSWATSCWRAFKDPVLVEEVRAAAGMDIGGTLIGMHLRRGGRAGAPVAGSYRACHPALRPAPARRSSAVRAPSIVRRKYDDPASTKAADGRSRCPYP